MTSELPEAVRLLNDTISGKLGRPAHCRKVKNGNEWYVQDPVFSFVQHGIKKGKTGYRCGYMFNADHQSLWFILVHTPILASIFKRNLVFSTLLEVLSTTVSFRDRHHMLWNSKYAVRQNLERALLCVSTNDFAEFEEDLKYVEKEGGFVDDLFPVLVNTGKGGGKAPKAGNTFYMLLSDKSELLVSQDQVEKLVNLTWPIFLCLYPVRPIEKRTAALARKLRAAKIFQKCEYSSILIDCDSQISHLCRGEIQGAHIKPHAIGGSDLPENGIWLCEYHHRMTEGKLSGTRVDTSINVRYVPTKK